MVKEAQPTYLYGVLVETLKTYALSAVFAFAILLFVSLYVNYVLLYFVGGILFLTSILAPAAAKWKPKQRISVDGKAVFISGCDRGFGFMLAQRLDDIGFQVFAGCLFPDGCGAERLQKSGSKRLHVVGLDVTSETSINEAVTYVTENLGDNLLWALVNNAGIFEPGDLYLAGMESIQKIFDVNTLGVIRLTKAFLQNLKESKGRVVSVASMIGRYTVPHVVPYCVSKKAVIGFCDGLRLEMYKWNVQVITIEPGFYSTLLAAEPEVRETCRKLWAKVPKDVQDIYGSEYAEQTLKSFYCYLNFIMRHPREVVSVMEEALTAVYPEYYYTPGSYVGRCACWIGKRLPKPFADIVLYYMLRNTV